MSADPSVHRPQRTLFAPAIQVMNRLKYPQKFALISLLFALPLALVMYLLVSEINSRIDFSHKEFLGNRYLRPLRSALEHVTESRLLAHEVAAERVTMRPELIQKLSEIDADVVALEAIDRELGEQLKTTHDFAVVKENWRFLRETLVSLSPVDSDQLHLKLLRDIRRLIALVGDTSNLILDPDLDSYYMMDEVLLKLPEGVDLSGRTRIHIRQSLGTGKSLTAEDRAEFIRLAGLLRSNLESTQNGFQVAFKNNREGNLRPALDVPLAAYVLAGESMLQSIEQRILGDQGGDVDALEHDRLAAQHMAANLALWDRCVSELDRLLLTRIDGFLQRRQLVGVFSLVALLLVAYLLVAFYSAVMHTVHSLAEASQRMTGGEIEQEFKLETRDELGQVAVAFNNVAMRLRAEWSQARDESARATAAEALLRDSEAHNRTVVDSALDAVVTMEANGRITGWNPQAEATFGWSREAALGQVLADLIVPLTQREAHARGLARFLQTGEGPLLNRRIEVTAMHNNGAEFPVELTISPARVGNSVFFCAFVRDITERRRSEEELRIAKAAAEEANRAKSTFLASMSHELRTPMNAIIGYSEMLQEEASDDGQERMVADLQKITAAAKHLLALINGILDLSKIEAGKMDLFLEQFDVGTLVHDVAVTVEPLIMKNANRLQLHCPNNVGAMFADQTKVRQNLFNLLSNAAKFTDHGTIELQAARQHQDGVDWVDFRVSDTGIGMNETQLARVFEPFTQAETTTASKYGGTGLGLTIARKFCEMMGGTISVTSQPGSGTTFLMRLPAQVAGKKTDAVAPAPVRVSAAPVEGPFKLLSIDDDPATHDLLQRHLVRDGFDVTCASSGEEGLRLARDLKPHIITLDVIMPDMDGWAVLTALKADPELAAIPVVMVTILEEKNRGFALGVSDYLNKPVDRGVLLAVLEKYRGQAASVLVVDDDPDARDMLSRMLEQEGWRVSTAENGQMGLQRVAERSPNLILLDLLMPVMDGFEFVHNLKESEHWRSIPIVVVTAKDLTAEDRLRLNGNVQKVLQKSSSSVRDIVAEVRDLARLFVRTSSSHPLL